MSLLTHMLKFTIFSLSQEDSKHELVGPLDYDEGDSFARLRGLLEDVEIVD